ALRARVAVQQEAVLRVGLGDAEHPRLTGALSLDAAKTTFSGGSYLPASTLKFALDGRDPTWFQFTGALHAEAIGPVRLSG
ncbi:hypothetical protein FPK54_28070, partial [Acinetobacter baumannii]|nr:hypothetical protein [Acinetobacter baumannii]